MVDEILVTNLMTNQSIMPKVSIVTPALNSIKTLEQTIQSVKDQNYSNLEHIVIDGGSTDGTLELILRNPHLRWISEKDAGQSDAINKGFSIANGEILGWLNADDTYNPGAVRSAVTYLMDHPDVAMVYSNCNHVDEQGKLLFLQKAPTFDLARQLMDFQIPQPTVFFRREMVRQIGWLDIRLHYVMDWAWFLRIGVKYPIGYVDDTWANFRVWEDTKTNQHPEKFWQEIITFFDEFYQLPGLPKDVEAVKNLAYARAYWVMGCIYHSLLISRAIEIIEKGSLIKALHIYPMLKRDRHYAIDQIVHWAIRHLQLAQLDEYIDHVCEELSKVDQKIGFLKRQILGHIYASLYLSRQATGFMSLENNHQLINWLCKALFYDPTWILNRGVQVGLFKIISHKKI